MKKIGLTIILLFILDFTFGQDVLYNKDKKPTQEGLFKNKKLWEGKKYFYNSDGSLHRIEFIKNGEFVRDSLTETFRTPGYVYYENGTRLDSVEITRNPDTPAKYKNGTSDIMQYIIANFVDPKDPNDYGQTKTTIVLIVNKTGKVVSAGVAGVFTMQWSSFDKEIIRVLKSMPLWTPALNKGLSVNSEVTLPIQIEKK